MRTVSDGWLVKGWGIRSAIYIGGMATYQIGTGNASRSYFPIMLKHGVAMIGDGRFGACPEADHWNTHPSSKLHQFRGIAVGDVVVAKRGQTTVLGRGRITSDYRYDDRFRDVQGWDLQHIRSVSWSIPCGGVHTLRNAKLPRQAFSRVNSERVLTELEAVDWVTPPPSVLLPNSIESTDVRTLASFFADERAAAAANALEENVAWFLEDDYSVSEYELTCHCVIPFLKLLGWETRQIKLEHGRVDVMLFDNPTGHTSKTTLPRIIMEVKRFGNGLATVSQQAKGYFHTQVGEAPGGKQVVLVATNGMRYNILRTTETEGDPADNILGGFSLTRLRDRSPVYIGEGLPLSAAEALDLLKP